MSSQRHAGILAGLRRFATITPIGPIRRIRPILETRRLLFYTRRMLHHEMAPRLSKWPFILADVLLVGLAFLICVQGKSPLGAWEVVSCTLCTAVGAGCMVFPFILEYRVLVKLVLAEHLVNAAAGIHKLSEIADQVSRTTTHWQTVQESADKTAGAAKAVADRMAAEVKKFSETFQRAQEEEKSALQLEVGKLRRAENDWLQVLVRMLDHVFALHQAAMRSRQPSLIDQLGQFQNACRDAARRVGLAAFAPAPGENFNKQIHQLADGDAIPAPESAVEQTVAAGYTFQGRLLRPALVQLRNGDTSASVDSIAAETGQSQLPLEPQEQDPARPVGSSAPV
jgi:molecular chaperone GrpE (heat shock protein)